MQIAPVFVRGLNTGKPERVRTGASGLRAHASQAGGCHRQIALDITAPEHDGPASATREVAFFIGRELERAAVAAALMLAPDFVTQVPWVAWDGRLSGIADGLYTEDGHRYLVEIKTMAHGSFAWAARQGEPRREHVLQAAISAVALKCDRLHIIYISKGAGQHENPLMEWDLPIPALETEMAIDELLLIVAAATREELPAAWHNGELIEKPSPKKYPCGWCRHFSRCVKAGPAAVPGALISAPHPEG